MDELAIQAEPIHIKSQFIIRSRLEFHNTFFFDLCGSAFQIEIDQKRYVHMERKFRYDGGF